MSDYEQQWFDDEFEEGKSKTQIKRELNELKELGRRIVEMSPRDLSKLELPEAIEQAVMAAQSMSKGALKRQVGFIGGLIAKADYEVIQSNLAKLRLPHQGEVKQFHQLEQWRDQLLAGDDHVFAALKSQFEQFDIQHVRQLVRNANKEVQQNKPPKSARLLFKYLQNLQQD